MLISPPWLVFILNSESLHRELHRKNKLNVVEGPAVKATRMLLLTHRALRRDHHIIYTVDLFIIRPSVIRKFPLFQQFLRSHEDFL